MLYILFDSLPVIHFSQIFTIYHCLLMFIIVSFQQNFKIFSYIFLMMTKKQVEIQNHVNHIWSYCLAILFKTNQWTLWILRNNEVFHHVITYWLWSTVVQFLQVSPLYSNGIEQGALKSLPPRVLSAKKRKMSFSHIYSQGSNESLKSLKVPRIENPKLSP